jgi:hypothetical protein
MSYTAHRDLILDQFTRQATPFSTADTITDANALRMIVAAASPGPGDTLLTSSGGECPRLRARGGTRPDRHDAGHAGPRRAPAKGGERFGIRAMVLPYVTARRYRGDALSILTPASIGCREMVVRPGVARPGGDM